MIEVSQTEIYILNTLRASQVSIRVKKIPADIIHTRLQDV